MRTSATVTGTRRSLRIAGACALVALSVAAAACGGGDESSTTNTTVPNRPTFDASDPCSIVGADEVMQVFGEPVTVDPTNGESPLTTDCAYVVGDPTAPTGRLVANVVFPAIGAGEGSDALSVVEGDRALAQIAGPGVFDLELGKPGFLDTKRSVAEFFLRPKLAVSLQWYPTGGDPEGSPADDQIQTRLRTLATGVDARLG